MRLSRVFTFFVAVLQAVNAIRVTPQDGELWVLTQRTRQLYLIYPNLAVITLREDSKKWVIYDIYDFRRKNYKDYPDSDTEDEDGPQTPSDYDHRIVVQF